MARRQGVILTRPASELAVWAKSLEKAGYPVQSWPLIELQANADMMRLNRVLASWHGYQAVMFVSRAAVQHSFQNHIPKAGWGLTRCWATGPGTRQALLDAGVPMGLIDSPPPNSAQFDTEALWRVVKTKLQADRAVLVLRGSDADKPDSAAEGVGRDWLIKQLQAVQVPVDSMAVYQRNLPVWDAPQLFKARQAAHDSSIWIFSSSQSVHNLAQLVPNQDWSQAKALATHERIAQAALDLGFCEVKVSKPSMAEVLASLESFE